MFECLNTSLGHGVGALAAPVLPPLIGNQHIGLVCSLCLLLLLFVEWGEEAAALLPRLRRGGGGGGDEDT